MFFLTEVVGYTFSDWTLVWIPSQYLVVKDKYAAAAKRGFAGTSISITTNGQRHLCAIGPREYTEHYVTSKVQVWYDEI